MRDFLGDPRRQLDPLIRIGDLDLGKNQPAFAS